MKDSEFKYEVYNKIIKILNIYKIVILIILKYIREKIYKLFILTLI